MKIYITIVVAVMCFACNDEFLEKNPVEIITPESAFVTYDNFKSYAYILYDAFTSTGEYRTALNNGSYRHAGDLNTGILSSIGEDARNPYGFQTATVPATGGGYTFGSVRKANVMLDRIDQSKMNNEQKAHWRSVGYFFRAYKYMELVQRFGDISWINKVLTEQDTDIIYGTRTPRVEVVDSIMANLIYAQENINEDGDGKNTINKACVQVLISRLGLSEGTWRKYHSVDDAGAKYNRIALLEQGARASEELLKKYPDVMLNYDRLFTSTELGGQLGIILYKEYVDAVLMHAMGHTERTTSGQYETHKYVVDLFLCTDGKPVGNVNSIGFKKDSSIFSEFKNRDRRLLMNIVPPYNLTGEMKNGKWIPAPKAVVYDAPASMFSQSDTTYYMGVLKTIMPDDGFLSKRLPVMNWSGTENNISPRLNSADSGPLGSRSGYYVYKHYNLWDKNSNLASLNTADKPIFRISEIMVNYAEIMWELGGFTQDVADATINKLRVRAGIESMKLSEIDDAFDHNRDPSWVEYEVEPVLWEIRRERLVELFGEGFSSNDIRRWKKGPEFINRPIMGFYMRHADYKVKTKIGTLVQSENWQKVKLTPDGSFQKNSPNQGYVFRFANPKDEGAGWNDKYYLMPIPLNDIALNPKLKQNNGW